MAEKVLSKILIRSARGRKRAKSIGDRWLFFPSVYIPVSMVMELLSPCYLLQQELSNSYQTDDSNGDRPLWNAFFHFWRPQCFQAGKGDFWTLVHIGACGLSNQRTKPDYSVMGRIVEILKMTLFRIFYGHLKIFMAPPCLHLEEAEIQQSAYISGITANQFLC